MRNAIFYLMFIGFFMVTGCATQQVQNQAKTQVAFNQTERIKALQQLTHWSVKGKIAFISQQKRQSASLHWTVNEQSQQQNLALTTYLGINILKLNSQSGEHTVDVDGEQFQGADLYQLIYEATGLTIPTQAMHQWLKGIAYNEQDQIQYHPDTQLPHRLVSLDKYGVWQIDYDAYQQVEQVQLAKKITIKHRGLVIKIMINRWTLL